MKTDIEALLKLPVDEKLEIVEKIWESIQVNNESNEIPDWHYQILEERLEMYRSIPNAGRSWQEVKNDLLSR
ncbi:MAG TPA: addiction module protein [Segetibacter sp.]|jgi:putative addiction module component (TIGR02574 family)